MAQAIYGIGNLWHATMKYKTIYGNLWHATMKYMAILFFVDARLQVDNQYIHQ